MRYSLFRLEPVLQPLDLRIRLPQGLLGLPALRDVAEDTVGADRASGGVARGDAGQVMNPLLPTGRMQEAILDGEPVQRPVVQLLARVHHARAVVGMQMLHPELQGLETVFPVRRKTAEVAKAGRRRTRRLAEVHLVEREAREVGARRQASLALPQGFARGASERARW